MEFKKAFDYIVGKVEEELVKQNYTKQKVVAENDNELVSLFTSASLAYSVVYYKDKEQMVLRSCTMTDEGPDNEWKTLATWLYDETVGTQKDADSIANDFIEGVSGTLAIKRAKQVKQKKKKDDDGTADPKFLAKRFVTYFPELREEIKNEEDCYFPFRGATFAKEHIAPKIPMYIKRANKNEIEKFANVFNVQYNNGDVDTRAIITIVLLNSLDDAEYNGSGKHLYTDEYRQFVYDFMTGKSDDYIWGNGSGGKWNYDYSANNVNWLKEYYRNTAPSQEHNVSVSGGSDKMTYYLSANYMTQEGFMRYGTEDYDRYTITAKIIFCVVRVRCVPFMIRMVI